MAISVTVCLFVCFCTVTDFSAEDKASGVKILHGGLSASKALVWRPKRIVTLFNLHALFKKLLCMYVCRESRILGNFVPPEAQNRPANRPARTLNYK